MFTMGICKGDRPVVRAEWCGCEYAGINNEKCKGDLVIPVFFFLPLPIFKQWITTVVNVVTLLG